jgi:putative secretion ATPase (PEP-CTERM system associated)
MYEKYFSLKYKPFELTPNPDFLFRSDTHKKAITYLDYGIKEKIGFILLTGEVGSGKTTIIRNLVRGLTDSVKLSRVNNTKVSSVQLISMINEDFGLEVEGKTKTKLLSELNDYLIEQYANGNQPILLIDEAQNLSPALLEEIRLLSNLETDRAKLLQIILIGQPELKTTLMLPELIQLRQRININYHIAPLSVEEIARYIKHRLMIAGNEQVMDLTPDVLSLIQRFSRGIPRLINILCDFTLLTAFVEGRKKVDIETVREVSKDLETRDYWNTSSESELETDNRSNEDDKLSKVAGDLALKIINIEGAIEHIVDEIALLKNKLDEFEKKMSEIRTMESNEQAGLLVERIEKLEKTILGLNSADQAGGNEESLDKPVAQELLYIKNLISDIDHKLKKI